MENKIKKKPIAVTVRELVTQAVEECGCTVWDVEYVKDVGGMNLIIYIDREDGISLDDCQAVNDAVEPILDEHDPIPESYCLEISSPGLERELKTYEHINAFIGSEVLVRLYVARDGSKSFTAQIESCDSDAGTVTFVREDGTTFALERKDIAKINTVAHF